MSGYVRLHRSLLGHPAFRNDAEAMAFAWMVAKAAWKPTRVRYKERALRLERGQLAVSQRDMARALDRDKAWIERLWKRLKSEAMIKVGVEAGVALITICKYDKYQCNSKPDEASGEAPSEAGARQGQGTEQGREEGKKKEGESNDSPCKPFDCPPDVDPLHWRDFLANRKTKRLTNSETAYRAQLKALAELSDEQWTADRLVQHAAAKGWGSINDPRGDRNGKRTGNGLATVTSAVQSILAEQAAARGGDEELGGSAGAGEAGGFH